MSAETKIFFIDLIYPALWATAVFFVFCISWDIVSTIIGFYKVQAIDHQSVDFNSSLIVIFLVMSILFWILKGNLLSVILAILILAFFAKLRYDLKNYSLVPALIVAIAMFLTCTATYALVIEENSPEVSYFYCLSLAFSRDRYVDILGCVLFTLVFFFFLKKEPRIISEPA